MAVFETYMEKLRRSLSCGFSWCLNHQIYYQYLFSLKRNSIVISCGLQITDFKQSPALCLMSLNSKLSPENFVSFLFNWWLLGVFEHQKFPKLPSQN